MTLHWYAERPAGESSDSKLLVGNRFTRRILQSGPTLVSLFFLIVTHLQHHPAPSCRRGGRGRKTVRRSVGSREFGPGTHRRCIRSASTSGTPNEFLIIIRTPTRSSRQDLSLRLKWCRNFTHPGGARVQQVGMIMMIDRAQGFDKGL